MKVMVMIKSTGADEGKVEPTEQMFLEMGAYNEALAAAGIMLDGDGLRPGSAGAKVVFEAGEVSVVDGPFTEAREVVGGYWIWQVRSLDEAIEWARRCPSDAGMGVRQVLEIRPYAEVEDFGDAYTPEVREREEQLAARLRSQQAT